MWQKKESDNRETISMEEYLVRKKQEKKEINRDRQNLLSENKNWILAELYM